MGAAGRGAASRPVSDPVLSVTGDLLDEDGGGPVMVIDCDGCAVRGLACGDCVVSVVLGAPPAGVDLDDDVRQALRVLADEGLVPRLRVLPLAAGQ